MKYFLLKLAEPDVVRVTFGSYKYISVEGDNIKSTHLLELVKSLARQQHCDAHAVRDCEHYPQKDRLASSRSGPWRLRQWFCRCQE